MSRLAAVHTGQPTQGMSTVPNGVRNPTATIDDLDPPPAVNPRSAHSSAAATVTAAWLSLEAKEIEVRDYFRRVPVPSGLELLAKMRHQCNLAAETLQQRMDEGNQERCTGCGKTLEEVRKTQFLMQGSEVDPKTGVPMPYRYCGPQCIRERNREKMMPKDAPRIRFDGQPEGDVR